MFQGRAAARAAPTFHVGVFERGLSVSQGRAAARAAPTFRRVIAGPRAGAAAM